MGILENLLKKVEHRLDNAPDGRLISSKHGNSMQYYRSAKDDLSNHVKRTYLSRQDSELIKQLAQKQYDANLIAAIAEKLQIIQDFQNMYKLDNIYGLYDELPSHLKNLIMPVALPNDEFVASWVNRQPFATNPYPFSQEHLTNNGEIVRSKSEKIIADFLLANGIPYKYEFGMYLKKYDKTIFPDFICLNVRTRKEYIWEHLGMMDKDSYSNYAIERLTYYPKIGLQAGIDVIVTVESLKNPLGKETLDQVLKNYLL